MLCPHCQAISSYCIKYVRHIRADGTGADTCAMIFPETSILGVGTGRSGSGTGRKRTKSRRRFNKFQMGRGVEGRDAKGKQGWFPLGPWLVHGPKAAKARRMHGAQPDGQKALSSHTPCLSLHQQVRISSSYVCAAE